MPPQIESINPADQSVVWTGPSATAEQVAQAVSRANAAQPSWAATPLDERVAVLRRFAEAAAAQVEDVAALISAETGKTMWESRGEAKLLGAKVDATLAAWEQRCGAEAFSMGATTALTRYAPHGVMVVLGPFNFPAHLPNGHAVPALLAGNAVVFKPSEKTPGTGEKLVALFHEAGVPADVIQCVQGARDVAESLTHHPHIHGVLFTGSYPAGRSINQALASRPEVIVALEMGGNNPLVVHDPAPHGTSPGDAAFDEAIDTAAYHAVVSAFVTAGQRCTCARRIIVTDGPWAQPFVDRLVERAQGLRVGLPGDDPEPFYGPVISERQGHEVLKTQREWMARGAEALLPAASLRSNPALISPGVLDATGVELPDSECFGPLTTVARVPDLGTAIAKANATRYGLSAALVSHCAQSWERFHTGVRAGIINWNGPTTGASGKLPFGGVGRSGNHRPAGSFSVDYCAYPVACLEPEALTMPGTLMPGTELQPQQA